MVRMVLILSGRFSNCPYSFKTIWVVSKLFGPPFYMSHERLTLFFYMSRELFTRFFDVSQKRICALRPESFRAWKAAIRKVSGFCASGIRHPEPCITSGWVWDKLSLYHQVKYRNQKHWQSPHLMIVDLQLLQVKLKIRKKAISLNICFVIFFLQI